MNDSPSAGAFVGDGPRVLRGRDPSYLQSRDDPATSSSRASIIANQDPSQPGAASHTPPLAIPSRRGSAASLSDYEGLHPTTYTPQHRLSGSSSAILIPSPSSSTASLLLGGRGRTETQQDVQLGNYSTLAEHGRTNQYGGGTPDVALSLRPEHTVPKKRSRGFYSLIFEWRWELFTWALGTVALASILILLALFANKPLEKWKSRLSINTMISALSQVAQSALTVPLASCVGQLKWIWVREHRQVSDLERFDDASRGPEGSVRFLWNLFPWSSFFGELKRSRNAQSARDTLEAKLQNLSRLIRDHPRPYLASVGAVSIIIMLAFSAFAQQAVSIQLDELRGVGLIAQNSRAASYFFRSASGFYNWNSQPNATQQQIPLLDPYMQAAISNGMSNALVTLSNVTGRCDTDHCTWDSFLTLGVCSSTSEISDTLLDNSDTFTKLPSLGNSRLDALRPPEVANVLPTFWAEALYFDGGEAGTANTTNKNIPDLAQLYIVYYPPCPGNKWKAFQGTLSLCIQNISSTVVNSSMQATAVQRKLDVDWRGHLDTNLASFDTDPSPLQATAFCGRYNNSSEDFCIGGQYLNAHAVKIAENFNTSASMIVNGDNYYFGESMVTLVADVLGDDPTVCSTDPELGLNGFKRRVDNLAAAVTNAMRTARSSETVNGTAWTTEQVITVDLRWLSFPVILWMAVTVFLFATIWRTRKNDSPIWKSSILALMQGANQNNPLRSRADIKKKAEGTQIRLNPNGEAWELEEISSSTRTA